MTTQSLNLGASQVSLRQRVLDELRLRITSGHYEPGERLTEERLCEEFGVSRSPVREAIQVAVSDGLLARRPRLGVVVISPEEDEVADLLDLRRSLEGFCARRAALRIDEAGMAELDRIVAESRDATERNDLEAVSRLNSELHRTIMNFAGVSWLRLISENLYMHVQLVFRESAAARASSSLAEHVGIVEAIRARDADLAEELAIRHVGAATDAARR